MAASEDISILSKSIRSSMGEATGEFRRAAANSGAMSKIIKDLSSVFNAQRRDIAELSNTISESAYEAEQTSSKMDHLSNLFREMISIQSNMQGIMREVSAGIRSLDNSIFSLNQNVTTGLNSGFTGLGSSLVGLGDSIVNALKTLALGAVGGAIGAAGYEAVTGAGGAGGSAGGGGSAKPMDHTGNSSEAMSFFQSKGWTKEQSAGIVGNLQVESGNFSSEVISGRKRGDGGVAVGIAQWHPDRQANFQRIFGKPLAGSSFKEQLEFVDWELRHTESKAGNVLRSKTDAASAAAAVDQLYERSSGEHRAKRIANASSLAGAPTTSETPMSPKGGATPQSAPMASDVSQAPSGADTSRALNPESMAGHGHGPVSGAMGGKEKVEGSSAIPSGDIIALGNYLHDKEGLRISEHPSFGGVKPVHKGRAHYEGRAIDINVGTGVTEASDSALGAKFDRLAEQLTKAGYKVYWRESGPYGAKGHNNHLHAEIPAGGKPSTPDTYQAGKSATDAEKATQGGTPVSSPSPTSGGMVSTPPPTPSTVPQAAPMTPVAGGGMDYSQMASVMGGMGMGGMGGMVSTLAPLLMSAIQSSGMPQMQQPENVDNAEMVQQISKLAMNNQMVSETAVQQQAQQEISQERTVQDQAPNPSTSSASGVGSMVGGESYAYNYPSDTSWPDWASMIGGNHWNEMKNFKKNMWA
jgi:hypothetical protein